MQSDRVRFSADQVADISGTPAPTIRHLTSLGVLAPSIQRAQGRGTANVYSFADVVGAAALRSVWDAAPDGRRNLARFFQSPQGAEVIAMAEAGKETLIAIDDNGKIHVAVTPASLTELAARCGSSVLRLLFVRQFVRALRERATTTPHLAPGAGGRAPRSTKDDKIARKVQSRMLSRPKATRERKTSNR